MIFSVFFLLTLASCQFNSGGNTNNNNDTTYVVTFTDHDGTVLKEDSVKENESAEAPDDPIREGYDFIGWSEDFSNVIKDLTVVAQYELHSHKYIEKVSEPTCIEKGYTTYTCQCGDEYVDSYVDALDHDLIIVEAVEATCTEPGLTEGQHCTRCDYKVEQTITPKTDHKYEANIINPTCEDQGYTIYTCQCGDEYIDSYVDALDHDLIIDEAIEPTCTEAGYTEGQHCTRCDYELKEEIPPLGHNIIDDAAVEPTCTKTGLTAGGHCSECAFVIPQEINPTVNHNLIIIDEKESTCTEVGYKKHTCSLA